MTQGAYAPTTMSAEEMIVRPVWSILSKGRTGTGKTILSCGKSFRPTYVFNLEGRFESVLTYYRKLDGHVKDLYANDFNMGSGFFPLDQKMDQIVARPEFQTIVVSGLTPYIHIVLKHLMATTIGKDSGDGKQAKNIRKKGGIQVNILEDYNFEDAAIIFELLSFLQTLKGMGINVILEAHISAYEIKTINEENGQREQQTIFEILTKGRKAPAQIPGYFNEVWLFEKFFDNDWSGSGNSKARYRVNTQGSPTDECKTSFGIPSFEWTNIDGTERLLEYLSGEIKDTPRVDPNAPKVAVW
jgi:hypothetical protein